MSGGIVTMSAEERDDGNKIENHMRTIERVIKTSLKMGGKEWNGVEYDGMLFSPKERVIIGTHKGPMLGKFKNGCPEIEVRHEIKKISGSGKGSLVGKKEMKLEWFVDGDFTLYVDPVNGRGEQETVGWTDLGVDFSKAGSITSSLIEWLPNMGMSETDPVTMSGLLDAISGKENYTMLFVKGVLILRTLGVGYSVEGSKFQCSKNLPKYIPGDKRTKVGQMGENSCIIDIDYLSDVEMLVSMLSSLEYPSVNCKVEDKTCVYGCISVPECDVRYVGSPGRKINKKLPTPERWWKALLSLACKLGATENLIRAFRVTRGWGSWSNGLMKMGLKEYSITIDCPETRGCRSVLTDSNLSRLDMVNKPTNLACSLGELICDWASGMEMINMLFHVADEFGLANKELNRNVTNTVGCSVGDSLLREAGFYDYGGGNKYYSKVMEHLDTRTEILGNADIKMLFQKLSSDMMKCADPKAKEEREKLRDLKNLCFSAYYGRIWNENCTKAIGKEGNITSTSWGATTWNKSEVYNLRLWMDVYGLSEEIMIFCGYNAIQKIGLEMVSHRTMAKIEGGYGVYEEVYRETNWKEEYEPRVGSETIEKERLDFLRTYLGMENESKEQKERAQREREERMEKEERQKSGESKKEKTKADAGVNPEKGKDNKDEDDMDATLKLNRGGRKARKPPKISFMRNIAESFGFKGIDTFIREVTAEGTKLKVKHVVGDGLCVAHALCEGLREQGHNLTGNELVEYLRREQEKKDWFEIEPAALFIANLGYGVVIYDKRINEAYGIGTKGVEHDKIIGITYDGIHCDALTRSAVADELVPMGKLKSESSMGDVRVLLEELFINQRGGRAGWKMRWWMRKYRSM
ncbi:p98 [Anthurium mosaic-associated virus]|uniref:p98 n=1 Tax=Anthurium mosaic-associated virus TaxID=664255 RepID=D9U546_9VIRU|nr:p98 [Anthurium mosaic-associated virus]ACU11566.1 p98 [Anthurium mosaic-associated virus]